MMGAQRDKDRWLGRDVAGFRIQSLVHTSRWARTYLGVGSAKVAIKLYPSGSHARVDREALALSTMKSRNLVEYVASGSLDDTRFVVTRWIDGSSLRAKLDAGSLPWHELRPIALALGKGLSRLHDAGFIHRDLNPSNVVLAKEEHAVLLDYSHVLPIGAIATGDVRLTERGWVVGTAAFMAPEQTTGAAVDERVDLYALGATLYESLTGVLPFEAASSARVMEMQLHERVIPPRKRAPQHSISEAVEDLVMWLLAKSPAARLPSARVFLHAVAAIS